MKIEVGKDNILISDFDDLEVYKIAMKIEKDGTRAYKDAAAKVDNERLKKTFLRLAEDEEGHLHTFSSLYVELLKARGVDPDDIDAEEGILDYIDTGLFKGTEDLSRIKTIKDAIGIGIEVEMRTMLFYAEVYKKLENEKAKVRIKKVIDEEKMHYNILKSWEGIGS